MFTFISGLLKFEWPRSICDFRVFGRVWIIRGVGLTII